MIVAGFDPILPNVPLPFDTVQKHWFSGVFRGYKNGILARNGLR